MTLAGAVDPLPPLAQIVGNGAAKTILDTEHYSATAIHLFLKDSDLQLPQSVITVNLGAKVGHADKLLLFFKSTPRPEDTVREEEEFLASVIHDLRNPLGAIFGYVDTLLENREQLDEEVRLTSDRIRGAVIRSLEMMKNYQVLSLIAGGKLPTPKSNANLNRVVTNVTELLIHDADPRVSIQCSAEEIFLPISEAILERVVANLLGNALKFTPANGQITVVVQIAGESALLSVNNSAPVIPVDELPTVFEKYVRSKRAGSIAGTGLGLYIVKRLSDKIGAKVEVQSNENDGTTFQVFLPRVTPPS